MMKFQQLSVTPIFSFITHTLRLRVQKCFSAWLFIVARSANDSGESEILLKFKVMLEQLEFKETTK